MSSLKISPAESEKLKRQLREMLRAPDNRFCADCSHRAPTWASINIGVFICMPCSGIHRALGTHITQVRSVDLDTWRPEWVDVMRAWGNAKANALYEAKLPKDSSEKPNEIESQNLTQKMQKFIRDKYERKKWYSTAGARAAEPETQEEERIAEAQPKKQRVPRPPLSTSGKSTTSSAAAKPAVNLLDEYNPFADEPVQAPVPAPKPAAASTDLFADMMMATPVASSTMSRATPAATPAPALANNNNPVSSIMALYGQPAAHASTTAPGSSIAWPSSTPAQNAYASAPATSAWGQSTGLPAPASSWSSAPAPAAQPQYWPEGLPRPSTGGGFPAPAAPSTGMGYFPGAPHHQPPAQQQQQPFAPQGFGGSSSGTSVVYDPFKGL